MVSEHRDRNEKDRQKNPPKFGRQNHSCIP
jgi:hypothetical protein